LGRSGDAKNIRVKAKSMCCDAIICVVIRPG
jgi:hypothetical protein